MKNILLESESECLDFKREYSNNKIDLIHDILCLANAETPRNRQLIFGVADDKTVVGVENDSKRKKYSDILTTLRGALFNHLPMISLYTCYYEGHEIDVLEIENRPEKPYFLKKDKSFEGKTLRAGVIYTRYGDTNTPINECADELFLERMFRERFGIDKPPLEKVRINLRNIKNWKWGEDERGEECYHDEWNPEFTLRGKAPEFSEKFTEGWSQSFPDSSAYKKELHLKFHSTVLRKLFVISCDGGRYTTILPNYWLYQDKETGRYYMSHFFVQNSLEYLVNEVIQAIHPVQNKRGWLEPFPVFPSEEIAKTTLQSDYEKGMLDYTYYFFDQQSQLYVRIKEGQSTKMLTC
jgi:hypothetical protein